MNTAEVDQLVGQLNRYRGFALTKILFNLNAVQLSLSSEKDFYWLTASLRPGVPYAFLGDKKCPLIKGLKKPLELFVTTHFKGHVFESAERVEDRGRVLRLNFESGTSKWIEISLFSGGQNVEAYSEGKKLSALKPKVLTMGTAESDAPKIQRDPSIFVQEWVERRRAKPTNSKGDGQDDLKKALKKKNQGLAKMEAKLNDTKTQLWADLGEWLKVNPAMVNVPESFSGLLKAEESFSWNLENCYHQLKKFKAKRSGTLERIAALKKEIADLEAGKAPAQTVSKSLFHQTEAKGKTHTLKNGWRVLIGKSATDNLALLRRAKPWYIWMHIKDFPGAYGIIERPRKGGEPPIEVIRGAAVQVAKRSVKGDRSGTFEVVFAECRYVRPIPKAKAGQVTYSHEKVVGVVF